jgi:hypothetical protein
MLEVKRGIDKKKLKKFKLTFLCKKQSCYISDTIFAKQHFTIL